LFPRSEKEELNEEGTWRNLRTRQSGIEEAVLITTRKALLKGEKEQTGTGDRKE